MKLLPYWSAFVWNEQSVIRFQPSLSFIPVPLWAFCVSPSLASWGQYSSRRADEYLPRFHLSCSSLWTRSGVSQPLHLISHLWASSHNTSYPFRGLTDSMCLNSLLHSGHDSNGLATLPSIHVNVRHWLMRFFVIDNYWSFVWIIGGVCNRHHQLSYYAIRWARSAVSPRTRLTLCIHHPICDSSWIEESDGDE